MVMQTRPAGRNGSSDTVDWAPEDRMLRVRIHGLTDPGRVRSQNEDQFMIAVLSKSLQVEQSSLSEVSGHAGEAGYLYAVADGMGGHAGGEHASALAIDSIQNLGTELLRWCFQPAPANKDCVLEDFRKVLQHADKRIFEEALRRPELKGMGTTVTMAFSFHSDLFVAHVGDSRCYLLRDGMLNQVTHDHTAVQAMVERGLIKPHEAARHRFRHVITNVVGGPRPGIDIEVHHVRLEPHDVVLLCSDGLTEMVPEREIAHALRDCSEPQTCCQELIGTANAHGGEDNITAVVARYE